MEEGFAQHAGVDRGASDTFTAQLQDAGRVSLTIAQQVLLQHPGEPDTLLAEGSIRIGWVDAQTLKPGRIPAAILEVLKS